MQRCFHKQSFYRLHLVALLATGIALFRSAAALKTPWIEDLQEAGRKLAEAPPQLTYLYVFAGPTFKNLTLPSNPDFLATIDANTNSPTFGSVVSTTNLPFPFYGNEPHHVGVSGDILAAGGLFSYYTGPNWVPSKTAPTPDIYFFNISKANQARPVFIDSAYAKTGAVVDTFIPIPDPDTTHPHPHFLATLMGSRTGGAPGKLAEIGWTNPTDQYEVVAEYDGGLDGTVDPTFTPHGMDRSGNTLVTADYLDMSSAWAPTTGIKFQSTVRVWDLKARKVVAVWDINGLPHSELPEDAHGLMTVRYSGRDNLFWFTAGTGVIYVVDADKRAEDGLENAVQWAYALHVGTCCQAGLPEAVQGSCVFSGRFASNTRMQNMEPHRGRAQLQRIKPPTGLTAWLVLLTSLALNEVRVLDTSDPRRLVTLQIFPMQYASQPHVVVVNGPATLAAVSTYYVEQPSKAGLYQSSSEKAVHLFRIAPDKSSISLIKSISFFSEFIKWRGPTQPHGMAFVTK